MQLNTTYIDERPEIFAQWLTQLASEHGFTTSVNPSGSFSRCQVKRDNEMVAELGIEPVGARLKLRPARLRIQYAPDRRVRDDFIEILDKALQKDYHAEPIERGESGSFTHWLWDGMENVKFDDPDEETRRQSFVAELARGLPALAPQSPAQAKTNGAGSLPPVEDPTDQLILNLVTDNPDLTDEQVAAKLPVRNSKSGAFTRQAVNTRRRALEKMGYKVR